MRQRRRAPTASPYCSGNSRAYCSGNSRPCGRLVPPAPAEPTRSSGYEVLGVRVMADDGVRGLLGLHLESLAHRDADAVTAEELHHLFVVREVRTGRVAPRVAPTPVSLAEQHL